MRRGCFFCLLLALLFAFASMPFSAMALDGASKKHHGRSTVEKKSDDRQPNAKLEKGQATAGTATEISPGQINAVSAILVEVSTGAVLFEQKADEAIEPASFTKIATLYLIFEAIKQGRVNLSDEVLISEEAWRTGGSKMFVALGSRVPLEELIKGIAVDSGNDACVAAAEHLSGSVDTFVDAMNRKAKELGMTQTYFLTPHGLPADGQITSARDMATLDAAYLRAFPEALRYHSMKEYTYNNIQQYNRNHLLLKDATIDGLKTGYIAASGYHLSATSKRDGMRLIAVVMGAQSTPVREREALKLLNYGFRHYTLVQPFQEGQAVTKAKVWKGQKDDIQIYPDETPAFLIQQTQKNQLKWEIDAPSEVTAPIKAGQEIGRLVFLVSGQPKRTVTLVSREEVPLGGWFKRAWQSAISLQPPDWKWTSVALGAIALLAMLMIFLSGRKSRQKFSK
jgi:D-alanyl-D-alanine carboxypeptidase (penicillin-binding protein 5/6)